MARVAHVPDVTDPSTLTLCPSYDPAEGEHRPRCKAGPKCAYVHADIRRASEYAPHERSLAHTYERFATVAGERLILVHRSSKDAGAGGDVIPASEILRALESSTAAVAHCVHFAKKGRCDRGSECLFVHHVPAPATAPAGASTPSVSTTTTSTATSTPDLAAKPARPYRCIGSPPLIELFSIAATDSSTATSADLSPAAVACFLCAAVAGARVAPQPFARMRALHAVFPGCRIASQGLRSRRMSGTLSSAWSGSHRRRSSGTATPQRPARQHSPYGALSLSSCSSAVSADATVPASAIPQQ
jgi:hypothetical protein